MKTILFIIAILVRIDHDPTMVDEFDMIEVNHYHDREWGTEEWSQLICWDWNQAKDNKFHVEWWVMMKDAYKKTEKGEKDWEVKRRKIEAQIRDINLKWEWIKNSSYKGDFVGGKYYPVKNWKTGYYEVRFVDKRGIPRLIKSKIFRETYTTHDPEISDKDFFHKNLRRGLTKVKKAEVAEAWKEWQISMERLGH